MTLSSFYKHSFITLFALALAVILEYSGFDLWFSGHFYDSATHQWPYKSIYLTDEFMHDGGRVLMKVLALLLMSATIATLLVAKLKIYRKNMFFLLLATFTGPAIIAYLKSITVIASPWDLTLFEGLRPYIYFFDATPDNLEAGQAFPGGHSSGGFAFFSLYFLALVKKPELKKIALIPPLLIGVSFALAQEVRGAHFPSHDMITIAICWFICALWCLIFFYKKSELPT